MEKEVNNLNVNNKINCYVAGLIRYAVAQEKHSGINHKSR